MLRLRQGLLATTFVMIMGDLALGSDPSTEGVSSREAKQQAIQSVPFKQLSQQTSQALRDVLENPSFYRRMPSQTVQCDPELFTFLARKPEVMVNTWDLMGITKVTAKRTGPYSFTANDGVGTKCKCDLVYGDENIHIYYGVGDYDGSMTARVVKGRAVCILRSNSQAYPQGHSGHVVRGTMDVFLKLDNLGADLLARTFGPLVAKTADHNFAETAQFISQLSQVCATNPSAALALAGQLNDIEEPVRKEFAEIATRIGEEKLQANRSQASPFSSNDPTVVAKTIEELKIASTTVPPMNSMNSIPPISNDPQRQLLTSSQSPELRGNEAPIVQLNLSDNNSARRNTALIPVESPPAGMKTNQEPPSAIHPRKPSITMRR